MRPPMRPHERRHIACLVDLFQTPSISSRICAVISARLLKDREPCAKNSLRNNMIGVLRLGKSCWRKKTSNGGGGEH